MNLFGKKAKTSPKDAIVRLRESLEMLEKREKYLQTKIDNELKFAKANASKNKRGEFRVSLRDGVWIAAGSGLDEEGGIFVIKQDSRTRTFAEILSDMLETDANQFSLQKVKHMDWQERFNLVGTDSLLRTCITALTALKRKRAYEDQINKIMGSRMTLEQQVMAIENANVNLETMNAMRAGAEAMKQIHGNLDINKVDATMDDIRDQMDLANEISDAISQPVNFGVEFDEDELNEELELLEQEELDAKLLDTGAGVSVGSLPEVPDTAVPAIAQPPRPVRTQAITTEEDAELEALKASMSM
ncbi:ESCRT-III subunit protein snf7 [Rhizophlyctis rosea]|nr:ESCRT-III subunit protein snf7 [Rhizophlyctis rosea]